MFIQSQNFAKILPPKHYIASWEKTGITLH